jgi:hypothetical protein
MPITDIIPGAVICLPGTGSYSGRDKSHNCVVVGETKKGDIILVPISTYHPRCDGSCIIDSNESVLDSKKKAASHKSFAAYYAAKLVPKKAYIKKINDNEISLIGHVDSSLLARVRKGIITSAQVEGCILMAYKQTGES